MRSISLALGLVAVVLAMALRVEATTAVDTLYAQPYTASLHSVSGSDWKNANQVFGQPEADCNDTQNPQYAYNDEALSDEYLEVTDWDPYLLPDGFVISKVEVDVNGRYDNPSMRDSLGLRLNGPIVSPPQFLNSPRWDQHDFECAWRMGGTGWDITALHAGEWSAANIVALQVAVRRFDNLDGVPPKRARVNAFRILVTRTDEQQCAVVPDEISFGTVPVGETRDETIVLRNAGVGRLVGAVASACVGAPFIVLSGAGPYDLGTNETWTVTIRFSPTSTAPAACILDLGNAACSAVLLEGNECAKQVFTSTMSISAADLTHDNKSITVDGAVLTVSGPHTFCSLIVKNGGIVTHAPGDAGGVDLTIRSLCAVDAASSIDASARGHASGAGPGVGTGDGGAAHGGEGGNGNTTGGTRTTYGSVTQPVAMGSGSLEFFGGTPGGGAILLTVGGVLRVDGAIHANGGNIAAAGYGGGSGGSVWLDASMFEGAGMVQANGGMANAGSGGGGGGGRIAVYFGTSSYSGVLHANGGGGLRRGGGGTIFTKPASSRGTITIANTGGDLTSGATRFVGNPATYDAHLVVRDGGVLAPSHQNPLWLDLSGDVTIESAGHVNADARGESSGAGPGVGTGDGGAAHGGEGGNGNTTGGTRTTYGSVTQPVAMGSGSLEFFGGTPGGGAILLTVGGVLRVDGAIHANGGNIAAAGYGGGSGGSVWLDASMFEGAGMVQANGGMANAGSGGGGGGGRIAVYFGTSSYSGVLHANGGGGLRRGGGGTIFTKPASSRGTITIANTGGDLTSGATRFVGNPATYDAHLVVRDGGVLAPSHQNPLWLDLSGDVTIESAGHVNADARGESSGAGPGVGTGDGGAAHGGVGGNGRNNAGTQTIYGSLTQPVAMGSGGVEFFGGAPGGGALRLTVGGTLRVDGAISANGGVVPGEGYGGASGGSLWLQADSFEGTGVVQANGGRAAEVGSGGGGGGGGRIAIEKNDCSLVSGIPLLVSAGGTGYQNGANGTIHPSLASIGMASGAISTTGAASPSGLPRSFALHAFESDSRIRVTRERGTSFLVSPVDVDVSQPGAVATAGDLTPGVVNPTAAVGVHILHFDPRSGPGRVRGTVTFDTNILGVITASSRLDATDPELGQPWIVYSTGNSERGLEFAVGSEQDSLTLSTDRRTLAISLSGDTALDELRVLTAAAIGPCGVVGVDEPPLGDDVVIPAETEITYPYPNPSYAGVTLRFAVPSAQEVHADIFDVRGRHVAALARLTCSRGWHTLRWDGSDTKRPASSGVYVVRIAADGEITSRRFVLIR